MINRGDGALGAEGLRELSHHLEGLALRALSADDSRLTAPQFRTLEALYGRASLKAGILAEEAGMHPSTMSRVCDRLVAFGFITRQPNPESRREVLLSITPSGGEVVRRVSDRRLASWTEILTHVPTQSRRAVADAVGLLTTAAASCTEPPARR